MRNFLTLCIFLFFTAGPLAAQELTFLIDNKVTTSTEVTFDVYLSANADFKLGSGQIYFNFNSDAFGEWVVGAGGVTINRPTGYVLAEQFSGIFDIYDTFVTNDNTADRFSFSWQQAFSSGAIAANNITDTPVPLFQVVVTLATGGSGEPDDLCFESGSAFDDQTFTACGPTSIATADCLNHSGTQLTDDNFQCSPAVPIELIDFTAKAQNNFTTQLNWKTANELNNAFFTIERSSDGNQFESILDVAGAGNSQQVLFYESLDRQPQIGVNYYRLKQTDFDGKFSYSDIRSVTFSRVASSGVKVFPNPASDLLGLEFGAPITQGEVQLFNGAGQMVLVQPLEQDILQTQLPLDLLPSGIYWIRIEADGQLYNQKVIISKQ